MDQNIGGRSIFRNAGRTVRRGAELLYQGRWSESVYSHVAWTELNARFDGDEFDGNRLPGTPRRQLYAEVAWQPVRGVLKDFGAAVELVHTGRIAVDDANTDAAAGHTHYNVRAEWQRRLRSWTLRVGARVENINDKRYAGSVIVNQNAGRYFEPAPGRQWSLGMTAEMPL